MATNMDLPADLAAYDYDLQGIRYPPYTSRVTWPIPLAGEQNGLRTAPHQHNANLNANTMKRSTDPLPDQVYQQQQQQFRHQQQAIHQRVQQQQQQQEQEQQPQQFVNLQHQQHTQSQGYIFDWQTPQQSNAHLTYPLPASYARDTSYAQPFTAEYNTIPFQASPTDYMSTQGQYDSGLPLETSYVPLTNPLDNSVPFEYQDFSNNLLGYPVASGLPDSNLPLHNLPNSPTDTSLEVRSLSSSDNGWTSVDYQHTSLDGSFQDPNIGAIFNPEQTLHGRTFSDSSFSDIEQQSRQSWGSYVEVPQHAIGSPGSDTGDSSGLEFHSPYLSSNQSTSPVIKQEEQPSRPMIVTSSTAKPLRIKTSPSPQRSPTSADRLSPPGRRQSKKTNTKAAKPTIRRQSQVPKIETEKRVGRRKGPLRPEQRKQASEIRKLGACIRCKFLKKTCDKGEPCEGCCPSHARLWQVPCTRIDIKEIAYFMKDWRADYERHISLGFSVGNIKDFAKTERTLFITHGYGHMLPVQAREVFVRDERCFGMDWVEAVQAYPSEHSVNTAKLSTGVEGISRSILQEYLDRHIDGGFEDFVDEYFDGTPFLTPMLKTAYRYWVLEKTPVIRKSLKLLLAYNLTQHVTMVEGIPEEENFLGRINDPTSRFYGRTVAPVMINFEIKCAMAEMWRELQREILEELSQLYSSVYTKDKLRHWPTIFMVASILLAVWEEMQFDCHYRIPDKEVVSKFCHDMESTPVGVIVGLFSAISQKLPSFQEWDTHKHHNLLGSNMNVCHALTEVRQHVTRHDKYLRTRCDTAFDRDDFDSLSSKFTSKLVIRASAC